MHQIEEWMKKEIHLLFCFHTAMKFLYFNKRIIFIFNVEIFENEKKNRVKTIFSNSLRIEKKNLKLALQHINEYVM